MTSKRPMPPSAATAEMLGAAVRHHKSGRLADAEGLYRAILTREPAHAGGLHLLGLLAHQTGRNDEAAQLIGRAIALNGAISDCHYHMGLVQTALGRLDAAATHFVKAAEIKPDHAEAHMDLGTVRKRQGRPDEALASYRRALELRPDSAQIRYNLANLLAEQEQLDAAVSEYEQALRLAPAAGAIHHNLAAALLAQNNLIGAIAEYQEALRCDPKLADAGRNIGRVIERIVAAVRGGGGMAAKTLFVHAVEKLAVVPDGVDLRAPLIEALTEPWGRPSDLLFVATLVLKKSAAIRGAIERARQSWPMRLAAPQLFPAADRAAIAGDSLLSCLLATTRLADLGLERVLANVRSIMLDEAMGAAPPAADLLAFHAAVAQQCHLNDYVYDLPDAERARADELREGLAAALRTGDDVPAAWVGAVAAYGPLVALPEAKTLLARAWPAPIAALLAQQIAEPAEEERLRETIPRLTLVEDLVSRAVQQQYAENPYPHWVRIPRVDRQMSLDEHVGGMFPLSRFRKLGKAAPDILIAGCGTGQQALDAADLLAGARFLAIDLSLPSLAFAKRKALELGLKNIEFAQADILGLGALDRSFDAIEAMGVLHHLADPWAGWAVLLERLAPGGVMRVGLYSEIARQDIVRGRALVAARGYRASADDIRRARQELIAIAAEQKLLFVRDSWDFYSMSECRDLLFHVQEHRMTLPQIKAFLTEHRLAFLGFEVEEPLWRAYGARFPADAAMVDLDNWHRFESENPQSFTGMYQFWVQKPGN